MEKLTHKKNHAAIDGNIVRDLLRRVQKPGRYTGGELNAIVKEDVHLRMGISYPDLYEIGMSNNGIRILYDRVNQIDDIACERFFPVDMDFETVLREEKLPLYTLETYTPLHMLDVIGFNLSHELLYTNMLQCLDLGMVPLLADERGEDDPIVIIGGAAVSNPMPATDFADVIFIGDGEDGLVEILQSLLNSKNAGFARSERINELACIEGVMIPGMTRCEYEGIKIAKIEGPVVRKRVYRNKAAGDPIKPIVPNIRITQERVVIEVTRGCKNFCKFCHAGYYDLPYRSASCNELPSRVMAILDNTGYNEVTLSSLSISDYRDLQELVNILLPGLTERGISISLPSLRVDVNTVPVIEEISDVRRTSLTFAVESASQRLREIAHKRVQADDIIELMEYFFARGWKVIKLYFMIGLPGCEEVDEAAETINLLRKILAVSPRNCEINVTLSPFVSKPHTPFEREKQMPPEYLNDIILRIKQGLPKKVKIKNHNVQSSILEAVLARGDSRLGSAILKAYTDGCRFDSWTEHFDYTKWEKALDQALPRWREFVGTRSESELLPWSNIKTGFEPIIEKKKGQIIDLEPATLPEKIRKPGRLEYDSIEKARASFEKTFNFKQTLRIRFTKKDMACFIPHIDFVEIIKRALRMARFPVCFSQGFNKRERLYMGFPVPLGIESVAELCDIELYDEIDTNVIERLQNRLPSGILPLSYSLSTSRESIMALTRETEYLVKLSSAEMTQAIMSNLEGKISLQKKKGTQIQEIAFDDAVSWYEQIEGGLLIRLYTGTPSSIRIDDLVRSLLSLKNDEAMLPGIIKQCQYMYSEEGLKLLD